MTTSLFFADEGGSWVLGIDWEKVLPAWFRILSATADPGEYAQRVDAILKKHYDYGRGKMLSVARRVATPANSKSCQNRDLFRSYRTGSANINTSDFQQSTSHSHFLRGKRHVMSTNKSRKKGTATTAARNGMTVASGVLNRLAPGEVASVLRILLDRHPNLTREAQEIAAELVSSVPVGDIADDVCARVTRLDMDDLHGRAGKRSWGYVEPAQAAQDLLEEAVAGHLDDMKRRMDLGLYEGAESVCAGIVLGLFHASRQKSGGMLEWAPDFPAEHAGYAIEEYLAGYPKSKRRGVGDRLSAALVASVSEWSDMIFRITKRSRQR